MPRALDSRGLTPLVTHLQPAKPAAPATPLSQMGVTPHAGRLSSQPAAATPLFRLLPGLDGLCSLQAAALPHCFCWFSRLTPPLSCSMTWSRPMFAPTREETMAPSFHTCSTWLGCVGSSVCSTQAANSKSGRRIPFLEQEVATDLRAFAGKVQALNSS